MSTVLIVLLIVTVIALAAGGAFRRKHGPAGGRGLRQRFGPEYDRALSLHGGDTRATDRELRERVKAYGGLAPVPLAAPVADEYRARWAVAQERFVEAPQEAVRTADELLGQLAADRGFPHAGRHDQQFDALSVHYADHVHGYRLVHAAVLGEESSTEQMREGFVRARALFDALLEERPARRKGRRAEARAPRAAAPMGPTARGGGAA